MKVQQKDTQKSSPAFFTVSRHAYRRATLGHGQVSSEGCLQCTSGCTNNGCRVNGFQTMCSKCECQAA